MFMLHRWTHTIALSCVNLIHYYSGSRLGPALARRVPAPSHNVHPKHNHRWATVAAALFASGALAAQAQASDVTRANSSATGPTGTSSHGASPSTKGPNGTAATRPSLAAASTAPAAPTQPLSTPSTEPELEHEASIRPLDTLLATLRRACGDNTSARAFLSAVRVELSSADFSIQQPLTLQISSCDTDRGTLSFNLLPARPSLRESSPGASPPLERSLDSAALKPAASNPTTLQPTGTPQHPGTLGRTYTLDVSDVPRAGRARTLAVAVAETLRLPTAEGAPVATQPTMTSYVAPRQNAHRSQQAYSARRPVTPPFPHARGSSVASKGGWRLPATGRVLVLGPRHTLVLGVNVGASRSIAPHVRLGASVGYLTTANQSVFGTARLHALSAEGALDFALLAPSLDSEIAVGADAALHGIHVTALSAWGYGEPNVQAYFALWGLHTSLTTALGPHLQTVIRLGAVKDLFGLRLRAGSQELMSLYGFGADLRLGVAYAW